VDAGRYLDGRRRFVCAEEVLPCGDDSSYSKTSSSDGPFEGPQPKPVHLVRKKLMGETHRRFWDLGNFGPTLRFARNRNVATFIRTQTEIA